MAAEPACGFLSSARANAKSTPARNGRRFAGLHMGIFSKLLRKKTRCHKCGRTLYLRVLKSQSTISSGKDPRVWQNDLALQCVSCRKITCNTCARKAAQEIGEDKPICPSCNETLH